MSDATKALEKLEDINSGVKDMQSRILKLEESKGLSHEDAVAMKEAIGNIESKLPTMDKELETITKAIEANKAKTKAYNAIDSDESKRKQAVEFAKSLRKLAKSADAHFDTNKFESVAEMKNYISGDDSLGGVAVIPFIDSQIDKLVREFSDVRMLATTSTISTDKWEQIKMVQGNGATWEKDMANYTAQTKNNTFKKLSIMVENLHSIAIFSDDLINDEAFNLVGEVLTSMAEDFAIAEATSFWSGDGVGEMFGILTSSDGSDFNQVERVSTAASTTITLEDIYSLINALKVPYQNRAQFKANRTTITLLRKLRSDSGAGAGTGQFLWQPSNQLGVPATLGGYPISQAQELTSSPEAANAESIVFGDFGAAYRIVDRMGLEVLRDNLTQYPNIAYKGKKRVGGGVSKGEAIKILKTTA